MLRELLEELGILVQRHYLRESLQRPDKVGTQSRSQKRLHRRAYSAQGPKFHWHMETNHKSVRCYLGFDDGFSRLLVGLSCSYNN